MSPNIERLWTNPIVVAYREEGLSYYKTRERLLSEWNTAPDLLPMSKIEATGKYYMSTIIKAIRWKLRNRLRYGIPINDQYLIDQLKLTPEECIKVKQKLKL
jgi:hypothetical protein